MKKISKHLAIEILSAFLVIVVWTIYSEYKKIYSTDHLIDGFLLVSLIVMFFVKSSQPRHFWMGFLFLIASTFSTLFEISTLTYFFTSMSLGFFILGVVNLFLFNRK